MSIPEPELPKQDDSVVETPSPNSLGDLEAQNKALSEQLEKARSQVARLETENQTLKQDYDNFLESSPVMIDQQRRVVAILQSRRREEREEREKLEAQLAEFKQNPASANQQLDTVAQKPTVVEQQLAEVGGDREEVERLQKQIEELTADRAADRAQVEAELKKMPTENQQDYDQLLESSSATIDNQRKVVAILQSRRREDREKFEAQLAELQQRLDAADQNPPPAIDLSGKAGELVNFFRTLLPKDTKLPKNTMSKLREILEATED